MTKLLAIVCCAALLSACSSSYTSKWSISAGSAGGFAGMTSGYTLHPSGDVMKWSGMPGTGARENAKKIGAISSDDACAFAKRLDKAGLWTTTLNTPGNLSMFIEMQKDDSTHSVQWGGQQPPPDLADWYASFMNQCAKLDK